MSDDHIFTADFKAQPYWWDAARPGIGAAQTMPGRVDVCIIGGGYAGLSCALELARNGTECAVLDTKRIGQGASSRNGGLVSGGLKHAEKGLVKEVGRERATRLMQEAAGTLPFIDDLITREGIDCDFARVGRFSCAWTRGHYDALARSAELTEELTGEPVRMVPPERQREEVGSDFYRGGQVAEGAATIHPAKYVRGLADAAQRAGATLLGQTHMTGMTRGPDGWRIETDRGTIRADKVMLGTNGYTGREAPWFRRRVVPVASFLIATEEIPPELARELVPNARGLADTRRVLSYFRLSPDHKRVLWGGRVGTAAMDPRESARRLHRVMTRVWPQLEDVRISHSWNGHVAFTFDFIPHLGEHEGVHFALGCQGSGVAMQTWMGYQTARMMLRGNSESAFAEGRFPTFPGYRGNPWVLPLILMWFRLRDQIERSRS
ncbi:FAD-binding oxidoreductase [Roseovarius sp. EGI FJ00037]|uniref:NAD(P)/FAD-dependent oxidoreductase n=1 Tax=Roseovarius salincola TaxID=2978479 RepID=UPI0022A8B00B|nr:FAD-binding oxidoreductase [Roseovarius sp. EGI FJ00037]MCZ0812365.1 FAD-binding oxidoreductase [Roseovarius sp. EGI FJ00037]